MPTIPLVSIVDDDTSVREATVKLLRLHGFDAQAFASGEEFLRSPFLEATSCLVLDVHMPGMDGVALQEELSRRGLRKPTIFITAFPEARMRERALRAGATDFLSKPFDGGHLVDRINEALRRGANGVDQ